jgi:hypothetical protein
MFLHAKHEKGYLLLLYFIKLMQQRVYGMNKSTDTQQAKQQPSEKRTQITIKITYQSISII